jgi:glycosyltransferase involved in cell wall biosynthesis
MRVALFTDNDFGKVNGVTTTLKAVLQYAPPEVQPRIYTAADAGIEAPDYFSAESFGVGLPWYREMRVYWPRLAAFTRALKADGTRVLHITTPGPIGLAGRWLAQRLGIPLVGSYHTHLGQYVEQYSGSRQLGRIVERYMRWLYAGCDPVLVPSRATAALLARNGHARSRIEFWARGVDVARFSPARASSARRDAWHVDARRPAILYAGRLSSEKGLAIIEPLQSWLRQHRLAHRVVFVGDGPMRKELQERCPDGFFTGSIPHDEVAVAMASADLFLFPSATDSHGNVVLEAQACGLPVLVSDRGGPQEHMVPGETGFICGAGDVNAFGDRLAALLRDPGMRGAQSTAARRYAESRDWPSSLQPLVRAWLRASHEPVPVLSPVTARRSS